MVHSEYAQLDISSFSEAERYKLMMGKVIPPHCAGDVTEPRRVLNAAPFSQFVVP
jgi:hypothetical protein